MLVKCWLSRYRDPVTWELCTTRHPMTSDEVAAFPEAKRIRGSRTYRRFEEEPPDTIPAVFRPLPD